MDLRVATLTLESFLLVLARSGAFMASAPIFSHKAVNTKLRLLIAGCIAIALFTSLEVPLPNYTTVLEYTFLIVKEVLVGLSLGFVSNLAMSVLVMAGEFIDREIGFTMAQTFDPNTNMSVTITAELYDRVVCLVVVVTNLHYFILLALAESFLLVPLGEVKLNLSYLYTEVIGFITQYFAIGFRIAMPVFLAAIMVNCILGVLAKSSPQMNMFAVGMQIKVFAGLFILSVCVMFIPNIANYLMERAREMVETLMGGM